MVKRTVNMPDDDAQQKSFPVVPVGEHKFQVTDVSGVDGTDIVSVKCEVISDNGKGISLLQRFNLDDKDKFFFITRIFLKCIGEPCRGQVEIDTDAWIGRQFYGVVKHSPDGKYANIKEFVYKDEPQEFKAPVKLADPVGDIDWGN